MTEKEVTQTTQTTQNSGQTPPPAETVAETAITTAETATETQATTKKAKSKGGKVWFAIMIVLCILLIPIIVINLTLVIKSSTSDGLPDVFGYTALSVTSGSMDGVEEDSFPEGALIIIKVLSEEDKQSLAVGDVVTFEDNGSYVTHRIIDITTDNGVIIYVTTKGDANTSDDGLISIANVQGIVVSSINGLGNFVMFLQTPVGIIVIIGVPVLIIVLAYILSSMFANKKRTAEQKAISTAQSDALTEKDEEIKRLKAELYAKNSHKDEDNK